MSSWGLSVSLSDSVAAAQLLFPPYTQKYILYMIGFTPQLLGLLLQEFSTDDADYIDTITLTMVYRQHIHFFPMDRALWGLPRSISSFVMLRIRNFPGLWKASQESSLWLAKIVGDKSANCFSARHQRQSPWTGTLDLQIPDFWGASNNPHFHPFLWVFQKHLEMRWNLGLIIQHSNAYLIKWCEAP